MFQALFANLRSTVFTLVHFVVIRVDECLLLYCTLVELLVGLVATIGFTWCEKLTGLVPVDVLLVTVLIHHRGSYDW